MVGFETAKRLKEAGFVINKVSGDQFWYNIKVPKAKARTDVYRIHPPNRLFAPTAIDILEQLPVGTIIERTESGFISGIPAFWGDTLDGYMAQAEHDNPAEAVAVVWLHLNEPLN